MHLSTETNNLHESALSPWLSGTGPTVIMAAGLLVLFLVCLVLGASAILLVRRIRASSTKTSSGTSHTT